MLNFKHLHYFWVVAKAGSITRASEQIHITPQTISGQISLLEEYLGKPLFNKVGRNLKLSDTGKLVMSYADEIFSLGDEIEEAVRTQPGDRPMTFKVGIADVVPKTIAYRLIAPAMELEDPIRVVCRESNLKTLLGELALHRLDIVIADGPIPPDVSVKGFNHALGECGISFLAADALATELEADFPYSLNDAPLLLPSDSNLSHMKLLDWLDSKRIAPRVVGEFDDSALMKVFGQAGVGVFTVPSAIADDVAQQYKARIIGHCDGLSEQFYAISVERKLRHPAVVAITSAAREWLKHD